MIEPTMSPSLIAKSPSPIQSTTPSDSESDDPLQSLLLASDLIPLAQDVTKFAGVDYATSQAGVLEVTLNGTVVKIKHDGGAAGCGGKVWPAGELLSRYLIGARENEKYLANEVVWKESAKRKIKIIELGSGTGLVGLALGNAYNLAPRGSAVKDTGLDIIVTDQVNMLSLMADNVELNDLQGTVSAEVLDWGTELPEHYVRPFPDVILAADCVYYEPSFPLLETTLLAMTGDNTLVLMSYKRRRKADKRFFQSIKKNFRIEEIKDYEEYKDFSRESVFLYRLIRKTPM
ncbi:putative methyltransferase-domain-containing protein [Lipomyces chichibuensis]|uniref:putative methyltransferase-domain-containing protein n=1 Tax=Lipomyces chichibuensis TaxID=1546026 RepID=UPI003343D96E